MAHRIYQHDKQQGIKQAWHGLTQIVPDLTLENCFLTEWDVEPVILQKRGVDTKYAVLECTDVPDLEVGKAYDTETFAPITNAKFLDLVHRSIAGTEHKLVSVGSVRNRARVFASLELSGLEKFQAAGREFSAYLNFGNSHDKSSVLWAGTSNTATVCDNTFSFNLVAIEQNTKLASHDFNHRVRHTPGADARLPKLADLIDRAIGVQAEFVLALNRAAEEPCNETQARTLFAGFVGTRDCGKEAKKLTPFAENRVNRLVHLYQSGKGNRGENLADAFNAVTDYYTHESVRGGKDTQSQFVASEFDSGARAKREFWNILQSPERFAETVSKGEELLVA